MLKAEKAKIPRNVFVCVILNVLDLILRKCWLDPAKSSPHRSQAGEASGKIKDKSTVFRGELETGGGGLRAAGTLLTSEVNLHSV